MKKYRYLIMVLAGAMLLACSGCSAKDQNTKTQAGMEAVQVLDYDDALTLFDEAALAGEEKRMLYRGQGLAFMGKNDYEAAVEAFIKALDCSYGRLNDMDYDINYYLATAYYKLGQPERAVAAYDAILALRPNEKDAYYLRGTVRAEQGLLDEARADFDKVLAMDSKNKDQLINIYCVLESNGYKDIGQEYLKAAQETDSKDMTDFEKGRICYYLGEYENAAIFLEKARNTGYQAVLFLGKTYETLGNYDYAVSVYNTFLDSGDGVPQVYNRLGICKMQMKDYEAALQAFQAAMKIENNDILQTLRLNEIIAYEYLGEYQKASALMEGYLKSYPDDEEAAREATFLKTR